MSLGGSFSSIVYNVTASIINRGIPIVVAAGNEHGNACHKSPASNPGAITVGGTTINHHMYEMSNAGPCVDILAPAKEVVGASNVCNACHTETGSCSNKLSGTSMATPLVAGAVALLLEKDPNLTPAEITKKLKEDCAKDKISYDNLQNIHRSTTNNCFLHVRPCPSCKEVICYIIIYFPYVLPVRELFYISHR